MKKQQLPQTQAKHFGVNSRDPTNNKMNHWECTYNEMACLQETADDWVVSNSFYMMISSCQNSKFYWDQMNWGKNTYFKKSLVGASLTLE